MRLRRGGCVDVGFVADADFNPASISGCTEAAINSAVARAARSELPYDPRVSAPRPHDTVTGFDRSRLAVAGSARRQRRGGRPFMISSASATAMEPSA